MKTYLISLAAFIVGIFWGGFANEFEFARESLVLPVSVLIITLGYLIFMGIVRVLGA